MLRIKGLQRVREADADTAMSALVEQDALTFEADLKGAAGVDRVTLVVSTTTRRVVAIADYKPTATGPDVPPKGRRAVRGRRALDMADFVAVLEEFGLHLVEGDVWTDEEKAAANAAAKGGAA